MAESDSEKTGAEIADEIYGENIAFWRPWREARIKEGEFLDGDRYELDSEKYNKDRRRTRIRGPEMMDTHRHNVAEATAHARSIEARPVDDDTDDEWSEVAVSLLQWELSNPYKMFDENFEEALQDCRERRIGLVAIDWVPDHGPFGEIFTRYLDFNRCMWEPGYHPHHPQCGWFLEEKRVPVKWIRRNFPKADWVQPDRDMYSQSGYLKKGVPLIQSSIDHLPNYAEVVGDDKATLWYLWIKNDDSIDGDPIEYDSEEISKGRRYMVCMECGFRSDSEDVLKAKEKITTALPEVLEGGCPWCQGDIERVDRLSRDAYILKHQQGRRLIVHAPFSPSPDREAVADGSWPIPSARSFPIFVFTSYIKPGAPMGPGDTTVMWDQQVAADNLRGVALKRTFEHRTYWDMPRAGIYDAKGRRFNFRDDGGNVMLRDPTNVPHGDLRVTPHSASGLDPQFGLTWNLTQQALTQYRGVTDFGLTPERSKNIAAEALARMERQGNIPGAHFKRRVNRELARGYGVYWDYIRATYTRERLARLRILGTDILARLEGDDLPGYDFFVDEMPDFTGIDKARKEAGDLILQAAADPFASEFVDLIAEINKLPPSIVRKFEQRIEEVKQKQQMEQAQAEAMQMNAAMGAPAPGPPALEEEMV